MFIKQKIKVPVEVSARHCHLSVEDLEKLFGTGYELTKLKQLSEPSDFACKEVVNIIVGSKTFKNVRIVGPLRSQTQVEVSLTDAIGSGIMPPIRLSGDLRETGPVSILGPKGAIDLNEGLIVALRHIHCATDTAKKYKLKDGDRVSVEIKGERPVVFENVILRVKDDYKLSMHLDTDEGNAAGVNKVGEGLIIK